MIPDWRIGRCEMARAITLSGGDQEGECWPCCANRCTRSDRGWTPIRLGPCHSGRAAAHLTGMCTCCCLYMLLFLSTTLTLAISRMITHFEVHALSTRSIFSSHNVHLHPGVRRRLDGRLLFLTAVSFAGGCHSLLPGLPLLRATREDAVRRRRGGLSRLSGHGRRRVRPADGAVGQPNLLDSLASLSLFVDLGDRRGFRGRRARGEANCARCRSVWRLSNQG